jgi:outer membrane lipoprotein-sorting protein
VPKNGALPDDNTAEIRIWYREREGQWLPRLAWTKNRAGDTTYVELLNVRTNGELPADTFAVEVPKDNTWVVQEVECAPAAKQAESAPGAVAGAAPARP